MVLMLMLLMLQAAGMSCKLRMGVVNHWQSLCDLWECL
jgi:hypothetical protein